MHGALLDGGRPTRTVATETNRLIGATLADGRAGIWDIGASVATSFARATVPPPPPPTAAPAAPPPPPPPRRYVRLRRPVLLPSRGGQPDDAPLAAAMQ